MPKAKLTRQTKNINIFIVLKDGGIENGNTQGGSPKL